MFLSGDLFYPRKFLILLFMLLPVSYAVIWFGVRKLLRALRHAGYGRWNTLVIGAGKNPDNLLMRFNAFPDLGYEAVKIMKTPLHIERCTRDHKTIYWWLHDLSIRRHQPPRFAHYRILCKATPSGDAIRKVLNLDFFDEHSLSPI